jgi:hypothetical protein
VSVNTQDKEAIHEAMNYQANMSRYTPTPPPDFVAVEEALGVIRDALTVHLDKVWKLALTDDNTVPLAPCLLLRFFCCRR